MSVSRDLSPSPESVENVRDHDQQFFVGPTSIVVYSRLDRSSETESGFHLVFLSDRSRSSEWPEISRIFPSDCDRLLSFPIARTQLNSKWDGPSDNISLIFTHLVLLHESGFLNVQLFSSAKHGHASQCFWCRFVLFD